MVDLEQAGWEKEIVASHGTAIQSVDDLLPFLKEKFDPGPACLHISSHSLLVLHNYAAASPRPAPKKPSVGRVAGRTLAAAVTPQSFPTWLDRLHQSELSIVMRAYARLTRFGTDACIIFTGESGSGKTVCCKTCLGHLASFSPVCRAEADSRRLANLLVLIGPLLDAFGNAATTLNDNSSRFGKCISTVFDFRGHLVGARVRHFMLERSRVTHRKVGERNFHIFYQLLKGGQSGMLKALSLRNDVSVYQYLSRSVGPPSTGSTDRADFAFVVNALKAVGMPEDLLTHLWMVVAAVIQLGQLKFEKYDNQGASVLNRPQLKLVSLLTCISEGDLEQFICFKHGDGGVNRISIEQAVHHRDMLAEALYDQIFLWLIQTINTALRPMPNEEDRVVKSPGYRETFRNINFVDFYGFAQQEASSFEQMCMNYSCEKLHQVFLDCCIARRLREFREEGVQWKDVPFTDNKSVCDLFDDTNQGIFTLLDRATCDAQGDNGDKTFLALMDSMVGAHETYTSRQVDPSDAVLCPFLDFKVRHFAGGITYTINGFVSSNTDVATDAVNDLFLRSSNDIVKDLGIHQTRGEMTPNSTVGVNFRNGVTTLTDAIVDQDAYHVRCLKPNDTKSPKHFDEVKVRKQCIDMQLVEAITVEHLGHTIQVSYSEFFRRYRLVTSRLKGFRGSLRDGCQVILQQAVPDYLDSVTFGHSLMFLKRAEPMVILNEHRERLLEEAASQLARFWKKHRLRRCISAMAECCRKNPSNMTWPEPTNSTAHLLQLCAKAHRKWIFNRLIASIPESHRSTMHLKVAGYQALFGKRRKWGFERRWHGDYLSVNPAFRNRLNTLKKEYKFQTVLFSSAISKVNKRLKVQERALVVTEKFLMMLDGDSFSPTKPPIRFNDVSDLWVSKGHDQGMAIRVLGSGRDKLFALRVPDTTGDFIGELVSVICQASASSFDYCPKVNVSHQLRANLESSEVTVELDYQFNVQPEFKKSSAHGLTLVWPV